MGLRERSVAFYRRNISIISYTAAVVQVLTVPFLIASMVGQAQFQEPLRSWVIVPASVVDAFTVVVLLVTGQAGPRPRAPVCHWCDGGIMVPEVKSYKCNKCGRVDAGS